MPARIACGALLVAATLFLCACESLKGGSAAPKSSSGARTSQPGYNLTGYSSAFKQGYADACATPRRRDAERVKSDADYSMGWNDGQSVCRGR